MTNADSEQGRFMYEEWHRRTAAADLQGLLDLYAEDVTFESPLVSRLLDRESGVVTGKDDLRSFVLSDLEAHHLHFCDVARHRRRPMG
jgi:ketosteroid isomerase-like protein